MKNVAIIYGECEKGIQKKALELLTESILDFTIKYPVCVKYGEGKIPDDHIRIYIGTKENNQYIKENSDAVLTHREEYCISAKDGVVMIEGSDDSGVLYGCADFYNKYIVSCEYTHDGGTYWENPFEKALPDFYMQSHPEVSERGIWTWGHVIYDYRGFIDNMVKLKMNTIIIWNDDVPMNAREMVEYAHDAGIKVIWGYSWYWDTDCNAIDIKAVNSGIGDIIAKYEKEYLSLGGDGIYFQSFTELKKEDIDGVLIAEAVTSFVNNAAGEFFKKYPDLELQFGLHASSVKEKLQYIKNVDPRVRIVWEDCGAFPFAYLPNEVDGFDETMELTGKIANLRGLEDKFGVVTKGITNLKWSSFEHIEGPVYIGAGSKRLKANRICRKEKIWKYVQSYWLTNAAYAKDAVRLMTDKKQGDLYITALVEDGMFEESIMFPVALYAEMLWNPYEDVNKLINEVALRNYVEFA